jgi:hypothetical protein
VQQDVRLLRNVAASDLESYVLLAYCAGLIAVCTGLLIIATVFTVKNYWMLRELSNAPPGKHSADAPRDIPSGVPSERYDSGFPVQNDEWCGPVTVYTPTGRKP